MSLAGLRVLSLESRRATEMETLIVREQGIPFVAPSVKERAVDDNNVALRFVEQLEAGEFDMVICMTGAGLAFLKEIVTQQMPVERLREALRRVTIVSRGPKPVGILRTLGVPIHIMIPEPNTWKEIVEAVGDRKGIRIAVQEYGRRSTEMNAALEAMGATVTPVALYRWDMPDNTGPLETAARRLAAGEIDVVLFTSSIQLDHLLEVADRLGVLEDALYALKHCVAIGSIGPVMTTSLIAHGLPVDIAPRHPKMWALVKAAGEEAEAVLANEKRRIPKAG
jgi:uroporphyrinogen-III synthase